jgi:hypothetical protein
VGLQQRVQELEALLLRERESAEMQGNEPSTATRGPDQETTSRTSLPTPSRTAPRTEQYDPADPGSSTLDSFAQENPAQDQSTQVRTAQNSGIPHSEAVPRTDLSHQVGLVSLSVGSDPRYVGPSSGYFFTKLLSSAGKRLEDRPPRSHDQGTSSRQQHERDVAMKAFQATQCSLPTDKNSARELSDAYFNTIHLVYPFLHKPTHQRLIEHVYETPEPSPVARFQVAMVLSISAIILSRRSRVDLPAAAWCAAALEHFAHVQVEGSVHGLQCLLLMLVYAMHSSSSRFNAWHINYQCLAMVLDLGLQRDPPDTASLSQFQREMRTRIFMSVYSLDRKLATMMGRPIGLRDEACDLRVSYVAC